MIIAIRKESNGTIYIDKNLREDIDYTKEPYNFKIIKIEDTYRDCVDIDFNENLTFSVDKYNTRKQKEQAQNKILEFKNWFDSYFDKQLNQSFWQSNFKVSYDSYFGKHYNNIDELIAQAEYVRSKIKELQ